MMALKARAAKRAVSSSGDLPSVRSTMSNRLSVIRLVMPIRKSRERFGAIVANLNGNAAELEMHLIVDGITDLRIVRSSNISFGMR